MATRMKEKYRSEVVEALTREFLYANPLQVPTLHRRTLTKLYRIEKGAKLTQK